ncbi:MAG TPA: hypothetical protein VIP11_07475 [Gemmatimonadaceae bacterium]
MNTPLDADRFRPGEGRPANRISPIRTVVVTVLLVTIAAFAIPLFGESFDRITVTQTFGLLAAIDTGINAFALKVHRNGITHGQLPGRVSQLARPILVTSKNSCGRPMSGDAPAQWVSNGPFLSFDVDTTGLNTPIGRLQDSLELQTDSSSSGLLLRVPGVETRWTSLFDRMVDHNDGGTTGRIRFDSTARDTTSLRYLVTVRPRYEC